MRIFCILFTLFGLLILINGVDGNSHDCGVHIRRGWGWPVFLATIDVAINISLLLTVYQLP